MESVWNDETNPLCLIPILSQLQSRTTEQSIPPLIRFKWWNLIPPAYPFCQCAALSKMLWFCFNWSKRKKFSMTRENFIHFTTRSYSRQVTSLRSCILILIWIGTIHLRRRQIFVILDPYPPPIGNRRQSSKMPPPPSKKKMSAFGNGL